MTTVGYGDIAPKTSEGKIVAVCVMLIGIGTATLLIGAVAQQFVASKVVDPLEAIESDEQDLLVQVREIATRLDQLQAALERHQPRPPNSA